PNTPATITQTRNVTPKVRRGRLPRSSLHRCFDRPPHALQPAGDVVARHRAGAEAEPSRLLAQPEGLERDGGEAGLLQQQAADVLVGADGAVAADEVELRGEVDGPLLLDGAHRQAVAAHG